MPTALDWLATAKECFADDYGSLRQGLLTSVFSLVVGLERVFHLDEMEDAGFARLSGGRRCPSRYTVRAGVAICPGTRWMPFAAAPVRGTCSAMRMRW